jgi:hypothetical protein
MEGSQNISKETRDERFARLTSSDDFMDLVCASVAEGHTLYSICKNLNVEFGKLSNYLDKDQTYKERVKQAEMRRREWAAEEVLHQLRRLGLSDIRELFNEDGGLKNIKELADDVASAVASVEVFEEFEGRGAERRQIGWTKKVKFWDKPKALELLMKNLNLITEKHDVTVHSLEALLAGTWDKNKK